MFYGTKCIVDTVKYFMRIQLKSYILQSKLKVKFYDMLMEHKIFFQYLFKKKVNSSFYQIYVERSLHFFLTYR